MILSSLKLVLNPEQPPGVISILKIVSELLVDNTYLIFFNALSLISNIKDIYNLLIFI